MKHSGWASSVSFCLTQTKVSDSSVYRGQLEIDGVRTARRTHVLKPMELGCSRLAEHQVVSHQMHGLHRPQQMSTVKHVSPGLALLMCQLHGDLPEVTP